MTLSPLYVTACQNRAYATAQGWAERPTAKELLAKIDMLERDSDFYAGQDMPALVDAITAELNDLDSTLDALRDDALDEAVQEWPGDEDADDVRDWLDERAPAVAAARQAARAARAGDRFSEQRIAA